MFELGVLSKAIEKFDSMSKEEFQKLEREKGVIKEINPSDYDDEFVILFEQEMIDYYKLINDLISENKCNDYFYSKSNADDVGNKSKTNYSKVCTTQNSNNVECPEEVMLTSIHDYIGLGKEFS